jgi:glycosyltransferase involved in cell wall biosynthesis
LEKKGYTVTIIHPGLFRLSVPLPSYPEIRLALSTPRTLRKMILDSRPDLIHIATEGSLGLCARSACLRLKLPFSTSYHTHFPLYAEHRMRGLLWIAYRYMHWFHNKAAVTLVGTESLRRDLTAAGFSHLALWPKGVDTHRFTRTTCDVSGLPRPVFAYFGRLAVEKNVEEFLKTPLPGSKLIIGDGPDRKKLERTYGSSARFVGYKTGDDLVKALSCADVFVFPSRTETFGLVIVEALSCGIPVAAHDVMGPSDIITQGVDGMLGEDLGAAAIGCLKLSPDACRAKALQYSWEKSAECFIAHLAPTNI